MRREGFNLLYLVAGCDSGFSFSSSELRPPYLSFFSSPA